jgi:NifU-like protein involved in Fe-S cluster formation
MKYESPITCHSKDMANVKVFEKWVNLQGQGHKVNTLVPLERSCHRDTNMKYESPIICHSKDMANAKVFEKWVKLQGQGHKVKNVGTNRKVLS